MGNTYKANQRQREAKYEEIESRRREAKRKSSRREMVEEYAERYFHKARKPLPDGQEEKQQRQ
jgi:hypothetical protein